MSNQTRIGDDREAIKDIDQAKEVVKQLALLDCHIAHSVAVMDKQIMRVKERHEERTKGDVKKRDKLFKKLSDYILSNKNKFQSPRKITTEFGSFGLQKVSELVIDNEEELLAKLKSNDWKDCFETVSKPIKSAVKKRLEELNKKKISGAHINSGDTAVFKTNKPLLDAEKEKVLS